MIEKELKERIDYLFNRDAEEELPEEEEDALEQDADNLVAQYGWENVYQAAVDYLHTKCLTPESAVNFATNYWIYQWIKLPIPDPHRFLGYFYYRINYDAQKYDVLDILDTLATTILPRMGYSEADLYLNPYYMPENDPKILKEVELFKEGKQS